MATYFPFYVNIEQTQSGAYSSKH